MQKLDTLNKTYQADIIITESAWLNIKDKFITRPVGCIYFNSRKKPVKVFELMAEEGDCSPDIDYLSKMSTKAYNLYINRKWKEALTIFYSLKKQFPEDVHTRICIKRCEHYSTYPPADDWVPATYINS